MAQHIAQEKAKRVKAAKGESPQPPSDFNDPKTQDEILNPDGRKIKFLDGEVTLYPLSAKWAMRFSGFSARVLGAAEESHGSSPIMRVGGVLAEMYATDFLPYVARALSRPDATVSEEQIASLVAEMNDKLGARSLVPLAVAFDVLLAYLYSTRGTSEKN